MNNYVKIHLASGKSITAYLNLKDILDLIRGRNEFMQIHRAFIISTEHYRFNYEFSESGGES